MPTFEDQVEERLSVAFKNRHTLHEAFVHRSYMNEVPGRGPGVQRAPGVLRRCRPQLRRGRAPVPRLPRLRRGRPHGVARLPRPPRQPRRFRPPPRPRRFPPARQAARSRPAAGSALRTSPACSRPSSAPSASTAASPSRASSSSMPSATSSTCAAVRRPSTPSRSFRRSCSPAGSAPPIYRTVHEEGPEHRKVFTVEVQAQGEVLGSGTGNSKQEAEREAAKAALATYPFEDEAAEAATAEGKA